MLLRKVLFVDRDPKRMAEAHPDLELMKYTLSYGGCLQHVCYLHGHLAPPTGFDVPTLHSPVLLTWLSNMSNWLWMMEVVREMNLQYALRYGRARNMPDLELVLRLPYPKIPDNGPEEFPYILDKRWRCGDIVWSHRWYYFMKLFQTAEWKRGVPPPPWWPWSHKPTDHVPGTYRRWSTHLMIIHTPPVQPEGENTNGHDDAGA